MARPPPPRRPGSSLAHVCDLPLHGIKIDRRFVNQLAELGSRAVVRAVATLAHDLGLIVTAEGIETVDQPATLRSLGVARGQGFLVARPLAADAVADWLQATHPPRLPNPAAAETPKTAVHQDRTGSG